MIENKKNGFTLVEMVIVTVIIGILAGIVINVINIPLIQARSRDSRRMGDLKRIQTALELYFADNREYPDPSGWTFVSNLHSSDYLLNYISTMPADPRAGEESSLDCFSNLSDYNYYYRSNDGRIYVLGAILEDGTRNDDNLCDIAHTPNCDPSFGYECNTTETRCYCVQNPM